MSPWVQRLNLRYWAWFGLLLVCGVAVLILGTNYYAIFPTNRSLVYNLLVSALALGAALWLRRSGRWNRYWRMAFAFFVASVAYPVTLRLGAGSATLLNWLNLTTTTSAGLALAKVYEMVLIVLPILLLTKISGADFGSLFLQRGRLKWWLSIGALVWFNLATSAMLFFATRYTALDALAAAVGWGLVFSFANGFMEELWLRGIFLKRFEPVLGGGGAVWVTAIVFALFHSGVTYATPQAIPFIIINTLTLGLACGYLILKTGSLWGAVLIHAGADLFLFVAMLANV